MGTANLCRSKKDGQIVGPKLSFQAWKGHAFYVYVCKISKLCNKCWQHIAAGKAEGLGRCTWKRSVPWHGIHFTCCTFDQPERKFEGKWIDISSRKSFECDQEMIKFETLGRPVEIMEFCKSSTVQTLAVCIKKGSTDLSVFVFHTTLVNIFNNNMWMFTAHFHVKYVHVFCTNFVGKKWGVKHAFKIGI